MAPVRRRLPRRSAGPPRADAPRARGGGGGTAGAADLAACSTSGLAAVPPSLADGGGGGAGSGECDTCGGHVWSCVDLAGWEAARQQKVVQHSVATFCIVLAAMQWQAQLRRMSQAWATIFCFVAWAIVVLPLRRAYALRWPVTLALLTPLAAAQFPLEAEWYTVPLLTSSADLFLLVLGVARIPSDAWHELLAPRRPDWGEGRVFPASFRRVTVLNDPRRVRELVEQAMPTEAVWCDVYHKHCGRQGCAEEERYDAQLVRVIFSDGAAAWFPPAALRDAPA